MKSPLQKGLEQVQAPSWLPCAHTFIVWPLCDAQFSHFSSTTQVTESPALADVSIAATVPDFKKEWHWFAPVAGLKLCHSLLWPCAKFLAPTLIFLISVATSSLQTFSLIWFSIVSSDEPCFVTVFLMISKF